MSIEESQRILKGSKNKIFTSTLSVKQHVVHSVVGKKKGLRKFMKFILKVKALAYLSPTSHCVK